MSAATARFKSKVIRRRLFKTRTKQVLLLDKLVDTDGAAYEPDSDNSPSTSPYTLIGALANSDWTYQRISRGTRGEQRYRFEIMERGIATPEVMQRCIIAFGNNIHEVVSRDEPTGEKEILWTFITTPTGEQFEE